MVGLVVCVELTIFLVLRRLSLLRRLYYCLLIIYLSYIFYWTFWLLLVGGKKPLQWLTRTNYDTWKRFLEPNGRIESGKQTKCGCQPHADEKFSWSVSPLVRESIPALWARSVGRSVGRSEYHDEWLFGRDPTKNGPNEESGVAELEEFNKTRVLLHSQTTENIQAPCCFHPREYYYVISAGPRASNTARIRHNSLSVLQTRECISQSNEGPKRRSPAGPTTLNLVNFRSRQPYTLLKVAPRCGSRSCLGTKK